MVQGTRIEYEIDDEPSDAVRARSSIPNGDDEPRTTTGRSRRVVGERSPQLEYHAIGIAKAEKVIQFIEKFLIVPSGEGAGKPFRLRYWQKEFIYNIYAPMAGTPLKRSVRRAILSMARKNGKTALIAALVLAHLVGPLQELNGEIYSAANDREQAAQVFKFAKQFVEASPTLSKLLRIIPSTKTINHYASGSFYRAISAEAGTKHGLNPSVVIYDELAQAKNRDLFDVLDTSMGARIEPLFITISTQSHDPQHILSQLIDDGLSGRDPTCVVHLYCANDNADVTDTEAWEDANPALGDFRSVEELSGIMRRAVRLPALEATARNLYLNQRVSPETPLITRHDWLQCAGDSELIPKEKIILGLDLSGTLDLTALVAISVEDPTRVLAHFWKPKDTINDHEQRDRVPYKLWAEQGYVTLTEGRSINKSSVALRIAELTRDFQVIGMAYDRWRISDIIRDLDEIGLQSYNESDKGDGLRLYPWGQGFRDMAPAIDAFEKAVIDRNLLHGGNPVLTWNVANAIVVADPANNRKLDKTKSRFRIDGAVALAMALGLKARFVSEVERPKEYQMIFL